MPYDDGCFAEAYSSATNETFSDGHILAFAFQGARLRPSRPITFHIDPVVVWENMWEKYAYLLVFA